MRVDQEPRVLTTAGSTLTKAGVDQEPPEARQKNQNKHKLKHNKHNKNNHKTRIITTSKQTKHRTHAEPQKTTRNN